MVNTDINDGTIQVHYEDGDIRWHKRDVFEIRLVIPMHDTPTVFGSDDDDGDDDHDEDDGHTGSSDTPTNTSPMHDTPTVDVDGDDDDDADEYRLCSPQIGDSVEVFWPAMGCWYKGKVVNTDTNDGTIKVHYEDNTIHWHKRNIFKVRIASPMYDTPTVSGSNDNDGDDDDNADNGSSDTPTNISPVSSSPAHVTPTDTIDLTLTVSSSDDYGDDEDDEDDGYCPNSGTISRTSWCLGY